MKSNPEPPRVAVLGGGITGLTAAWHLERAGLRAIVLEMSARVGGVVGARRTGGWLHELGPNSLLEGAAETAAFIEALGLADRRLYAAPAAKQRYIVRRGRPVPMPASPLAFVATPLFSWRAKLALLGEPWRARGTDPGESVAGFVARRLGREFLDYAINPFVGGVYAGDPAALSVRHAFPRLHALEQEHGSLLRGALKLRNASGAPKGRMFSFPEGLGEIPAALHRSLGEAVRLGTRVLRVGRDAAGWHVTTECAGVTQTEPFAAVVCALPADALAELSLDGVRGSGGLTLLREIPHPPVASVLLGYRRGDVRHPLDGFGVLMPAVEQGRILGTLFSSTLFPGRAPAGHVALTTFVGGTRQPALAELEDKELTRVIQEELGRILGAGAPVFCSVQRWPRSIPQYILGYQRFKDAMTGVEAGAPGLFIGGNCRDGIALANCIESGKRLAAAAAAHLLGTPQGASGRTLASVA